MVFELVGAVSVIVNESYNVQFDLKAFVRRLIYSAFGMLFEDVLQGADNEEPIHGRVAASLSSAEPGPFHGVYHILF